MSPNSSLYDLLSLGYSKQPMLSFPEVAVNGVCLCTQQSSAQPRPVPFLMPGTTSTRHFAFRKLMAQLGRRVLSLPTSAFSSTFVKKNGSTERLQTPVFLHHVLLQCSDHSALSALCVSSRATSFSSPVLVTSSFVFEELGIAFISSFPPVHHKGV